MPDWSFTFRFTFTEQRGAGRGPRLEENRDDEDGDDVDDLDHRVDGRGLSWQELQELLE